MGLQSTHAINTTSVRARNATGARNITAPRNLTHANGFAPLNSTVEIPMEALELPIQHVITFIDSGSPEIWLPSKTCESLQSLFDLVYSASLGLFAIGPPAHLETLKTDPSLFFLLANNSQPQAPNVTVAIPYQSLALTLTSAYPGADNGTLCFLIQNTTLYTLGRAFLQYAYAIADYERPNQPGRLRPCAAATAARDRAHVDLQLVPAGRRKPPGGASAAAPVDRRARRHRPRQRRVRRSHRPWPLPPPPEHALAHGDARAQTEASGAKRDGQARGRRSRRPRATARTRGARHARSGRSVAAEGRAVGEGPRGGGGGRGDGDPRACGRRGAGGAGRRVGWGVEAGVSRGGGALR